MNKGLFAIIIASLLWGTTGTAANYAPDINPLAIGAFAMGVGGLCLVLSAWSSLRNDFRVMLAHPKILIFGSMSVAVYPLAFYSSMRMSGVAIGTVVSIASAPFFAALLERLVSKKVIALHWMISFVIGALGIGFMTAGKSVESLDLASSQQHYVGVMLGLLAGLTYAGYSWAAKHMIEVQVRSQSAMAAMFGLAALVLLPSLFFTGEQLFASVTNASVAIYMAIIPMFFGYLLFGYGLRLVEASKATLITLIEPLVATLLAILIVGEVFNMIGWVGMGLIACCLILQTVNTKTVTVD